MFVTGDTHSENCGVVAVAAALNAIDVSRAAAAGLAEVTVLARRLAGSADAVLLEVAERSAQLHTAGASAMPVDVLTTSGRMSGREAGRVVKRADTISWSSAVPGGGR